MNLTLEEIDALLKFLDHQWMPDAVQQAYDKLAAEKRARLGAEERLADLERRLRQAASEPRSAPRAVLPEPDDGVSREDAERTEHSRK